MAVRVMIAEGNPFVRVGLETVLAKKEGLVVCGVFDSGEAALRACAHLRPCVIMIDRELACEISVEALRDQCDSQTGVLVFLDRLHEEEVYGLLSAGVAGFIAKRDDPSILCEAVRAVARGEEMWLSPRVSRMLMPPSRNQSAKVGLTTRERSILRAMANGSSNAMIAEQECLSGGTVRNVISTIYAKLGVAGRAGAVAWAWRNGLVEVGMPEANTGNE